MLSYWILRRTDGTPAGLVRVENDRVLLNPTAPIPGTFTLFSATAAVPILPETETVLCGACAVLGTDGGQTTCFAAAPDAASLAVYRHRLSQLCTIEPTPQHETNITQIEEETPQEPEELSQINTIEAEKSVEIDETAQATAEFSVLLRHAEAFYTAYETTTVVQKEDRVGINLFPQAFPGARWRYVDGADVLPHFEGIWKSAAGIQRILAVRGRAAPRPPRALFGFTRYLRGTDGNGYWIKTEFVK